MSAKALFKQIKEHKAKIAGPHFIFSAENPKYGDKNKLGLSHEQVLAHLHGAGYDAHEVQGHYGAPERSIIVYGVNNEHIQKLHGLAANLGQDSSIHSDGTNHEMRFHHGDDAGKKITGKGTVWHTQKPGDFYTALPGGVHHFTHNFDFGKSENSELESLAKSEDGIVVYHGSTHNFDKFDVAHQRSGFYPGIYSTPDPDRAKTHGPIVHSAKLKGKYFEFKDPDHGDRLARELGVPHGASGHPLAAKLQEMGYAGIKRGTEYITFHHDNIEKLNEQPLKKSESINQLTLVHYSSQGNLKTIDPKFKGTGVDARTKGRDSWHPHAFFYIEGTEPEQVVVGQSSYKYIANVDLEEKRIYDIGQDPKGFIAKSLEANNGAFNMDLVHEELKKSGFFGFYNSKHPQLNNVVVAYEPVEVKSHVRIR
jgi:hypothetical protein